MSASTDTPGPQHNSAGDKAATLAWGGAGTGARQAEARWCTVGERQDATTTTIRPFWHQLSQELLAEPSMTPHKGEGQSEDPGVTHPYIVPKPFPNT